MDDVRSSVTRVVTPDNGIACSSAYIRKAMFWILFNFFDQLIFFDPIWIFYLPDDAIAGFILTTMISILMGILVSMNIYAIRHSKLKISRKSLFSGSSLSITSGVCSSCSSVDFF